MDLDVETTGSYGRGRGYIPMEYRDTISLVQRVKLAPNCVQSWVKGVTKRCCRDSIGRVFTTGKNIIPHSILVSSGNVVEIDDV